MRISCRAKEVDRGGGEFSAVVDISRKGDDVLGPLYTSSGSRLSSLLHLGVRNRLSELAGY